jgi:hypothetical protein
MKYWSVEDECSSFPYPNAIVELGNKFFVQSGGIGSFIRALIMCILSAIATHYLELD